MADFSIYKQTNLLYTQEPFSKYRSGGYHPVCLGDTFNNGRYKVYHKLGFGGSSTIWLANDRQEKQWVALKIMTADRFRISRELRNLQLLATSSQGSLSSEHIVQLLNDFTHEGPNGVHQCLVLELLGPTVYTLLSDNDPQYGPFEPFFEPETILLMSEQLLTAIQFIHNAGMGHGDLNAANVAFRCSNLANVTEEEILEVTGHPKPEELARLDGKPLNKGLPKQLVEVAQWYEFDEYEEDIRILDVGEAFIQGDDINSVAQPAQLWAPGRLFMEGFDHKQNLWGAACTIHFFIFGSYPYMYQGDDAVLVAQMIDFVGDLPEDWQPRWERMLLNSEHQEYLNESNGLKQLNWNGLMRFLPSDRMSTYEAVSLLTPKQPESTDE